MIKKGFNKIIEYIKEEYKFLIFLIIFTGILIFPLDYLIFTGGGMLNTTDKIKVEDATSSEGTFNLSYVSQKKGNILTVGLSFLIPSWEREKLSDYTYSDDESFDEIKKRSEISLNETNQNAIYLAFTKAGINVESTGTDAIVISNIGDNNYYKVGDIIRKIDDVNFFDIIQQEDYFKKYEAGSDVEVLIERDKKEKIINAKLEEIDGKNALGVALSIMNTFDTPVDVDINFSSSEGGPSGGLLTTLYIYDQLIKEDLTKGYTIAGSGTIDYEGVAGEIGEVEHKVRGAVKEGADIFIAVNGNNYNNAKKVINDENLDIKLIGVDSFEDAVNKLEKLK